MTMEAIDALARRARTRHNRRTSLKALGGVALLAAATAPRSAQAKQRAGKQAKKRCKKQVTPCRTTLAGRCEPGPAFDSCVANAAECSAHLATCDAATAMPCIIGKFVV